MSKLHVLIGSKSDMRRLDDLVIILNEVLGEDGWSYASCSAHRDPEELGKYVTQAVAEGAQVFICVAGLACALPGAVAGHARTKLVLGVPLDRLEGLDTCLSTAPDVPVATAGVGQLSPKRAAILACQVLGVADPQVEGILFDYLEETAKAPDLDLPREKVGK